MGVFFHLDAGPRAEGCSPYPCRNRSQGCAGKLGDDSTTNDDAALECYGIRPEVWIEAKKDFETDDFDKAIFAAFKYVETAIQIRSGLQSLGRGLIDTAFSTKI